MAGQPPDVPQQEALLYEAGDLAATLVRRELPERPAPSGVATGRSATWQAVAALCLLSVATASTLAVSHLRGRAPSVRRSAAPVSMFSAFQRSAVAPAPDAAASVAASATTHGQAIAAGRAASATPPTPSTTPAISSEGAAAAAAATSASDASANPFEGVASILEAKVGSVSSEVVTEWEVVFRGGLVNVRQGKNSSAKKLKSVKTGTVVLGSREGDWLKLSGMKGYMLVSIPRTGYVTENQELLRERRASYFVSDESECESDSAFPIPDPVVCKHAAAVLGELVNHVDDSRGCRVNRSTAAPGGLPLTGRRLQPRKVTLVESNLSVAHLSPSGKSGAKLICSTLEYPLDLRVPVRTTTRTTTTATSATTMTVEPWGSPSLFCFAVFRANTAEQDLVKEACRLQSGIFACDTTVTISGEKIWVGKDKKGKDVWSWVNEVPEVGMGDIANNPDQTTNSWLNTQVFINAIDMLVANELIWQHDWVVKGDPDAVLFPDRIRTHLTNSGQTGNAAFLENCFHDGQWWLYGSLELFSKPAMESYRDRAEQECRQGLDWHGWGEDMYMDVCMKKLGAAAIISGTIVADHYCSPRDCHDGEPAAFHPFKSKDAWRDCLSQSTGRSFAPA